MEDSVLRTVRKLACGNENYTHFDTDLIVLINSTFATLTQLGVGPDAGFSIDGPEDPWTGYSDDPVVMNLVQGYVPLKVRLIFDPPLTTSVLEALTKQVAEYEWRLGIQDDRPKAVN